MIKISYMKLNNLPHKKVCLGRKSENLKNRISLHKGDIKLKVTSRDVHLLAM